MPAAVTLSASPQLHYGEGSFEKLGGEVARLLGRPGRVLLVADPALDAWAQQALSLLAEAGHRVELFRDLRSDPRAAEIDAAAAAARGSRAQAVVGLGGGSALDVAKLAAAVAGAESPCETYGLARAPLPRPLLKVLIPTTAGTGSEATRTAVFTTAEGAKVWAWGEELRSDLALLDPRLTAGLPPALTAATGVDALVHAIEASTNRRSHPLSRAPGLMAVALVRRHLPQALKDPADLEARGGLLLAAWLAGQAIDIAGTGIAHALGHALGALGKVHHGRAVGLSLRVALPDNAASAPEAHAEVARAFGLAASGARELAAALPDAYDAFLREVGLPLMLADAGLDRHALLAEMARPENQPMLAANCHAYDAAGLGRLCEALLAA